jgi:hypothetical protein
MLDLVASAYLFVVAPEADPQRIELLALDVEGVDPAAFGRALKTRLPERPTIPAGNPDARNGSHWGYVLVRPVEGGWSLALILDDGRGYYREVAGHDGGEPARLVTNTLANLIASVEEDAIVADAEDVVVPDEVVDDEHERELEPEPEPEPLPEPEPEPEPAPELPVEPSPAYGVRIGALAAWALGPPAPAGFAAAGAELDVHVRFPNALVVGGGLGGLGSRSSAYGLGRLRISAHVGHSLRRDRFELLSLVGVRAEPWFVSADSGSASLRAGNDPRSLSIVAGGFIQASPGLRVDAGSTQWRIGPTLRLSGASALGNGGGVARVLRTTEDGPDALFRLGGLELETGLDVTVWFNAG